MGVLGRVFLLLSFSVVAKGDFPIPSRSHLNNLRTCFGATFNAATGGTLAEAGLDGVAARALADSFEERGMPVEARWLRVSVEIEELLANGNPNPERLLRLRRLQELMLQRNYHRWLARDLAGDDWFHPVARLRNGLPVRFQATPDHMRNAGPDTLEENPTLTELELRHFTADELRTMLQNPRLARALGRTTEINFQTGQLGPEGARHLAESTALGSLRRLTLRDQGIGVDGLARILSSRNLSRIDSLRLHNEDLSQGTGPFFAAMPERMRELDLRFCSLDESEARAISQTINLYGLTHLNLSSNYLTDNSVRMLIRRLRNLNFLDIGDNGITLTGVRELLGSENSRSIRTLGLQAIPLARTGIREIMDSANLPNLRELSIPDTGLRVTRGRNDLEGITRNRNAERLTSLNLAGNELDNAGATEIARSRHLGNLGTLNVSRTHMGAAGFRALAESPNLRSLHTIIVTARTEEERQALEPFRLRRVRIVYN